MENLEYACIYLDGAALWIAVVMFIILLIGFIFMGLCYLAAERKADRLAFKYQRTKADLRVAEMELESQRLKTFIKTENDCPYKVEPERGAGNGKVFD